MDFDGNIEFTVAVRASRATPVDDIRLEIPIAADVARFLMGLGFKGGTRPASLDWKWDVKHNQDSAWIGDVNAGLQFTLKDDKYVRPLNTNFYTLKPLVMPASWYNGGKGGCRLAEKGRGHLPRELLQRRAHDRARRDALLQLPSPADAVQAARHRGAVRHPATSTRSSRSTRWCSRAPTSSTCTTRTRSTRTSTTRSSGRRR